MEKIQIILTVAIFLAFYISTAKALKNDSSELERLLNPQHQHIMQERSGTVFIYDGLYDSDIEIALDQQFTRIEHMMFIRTKVIEEGVVTEVDDCD